MPFYKIGLDFGTHQTKVCLEDSSDRRNKRYFFHRFTDGEGRERYTMPSTVMVKKDHTLAYGNVDESQALRTQIAPLTEEPSRPKLVLWQYPPEPKLPDLPEVGEVPQKPDYNKIFSKYPKPVMLQVPETPDRYGAQNQTLVSNDLSDFTTMPNEQSETTQKKKSFGEALIEYQKAMKRYNFWLKKAKSKANHIYQEQLRLFEGKIDHYNTIKARRDRQIESYERRCREVDEHNEQCQRQMVERMAKYEKDLKLWNEEKERHHPIVMRYFKQALFSTGLVWRYEWSPLQVSIWYLTEVFFDLDEKYGIENLMVYMGTSSGKHNWGKNKEIASQVILSVYYLIEEVFHHNRDAFHRCPVEDLISLTTVVPFSYEAKRDNSIYVFPEAYANLNPMALSGKFGNGMNILVDIGGGTTDISLFSAPNGSDVLIYDYVSVPYGLNAVNEIGVDRYKSAVLKDIYTIVRRIENHARFIGVPEKEITRVMRNRPIVFTGGGSTQYELCCEYLGFNDIKHLKDNVGDRILIEDKANVVEQMAVLSTALGLAMCKDKDDSEIKIQTIQELFRRVEEAYSAKRHSDNNDQNDYSLSDRR